MAAVISTRIFSASAPVATEAELLVRCQRFEPEALGDVFERFHDQVFAFLAARTGDAGLSEELTRETFIRALALMGKHRNRGAGLGPWLLRVANGRLVERRGMRSGPAPAQPISVDPGPEGEVTRLRAALDTLPPDQQEVLGLRFIAHLPLPVVARAVHRSQGGVRATQARALKALNRLLATDGAAGDGVTGLETV